MGGCAGLVRTHSRTPSLTYPAHTHHTCTPPAHARSQHKKGYSAQLEPMLLQHVVPLFEAPQGHLRCARAGRCLGLAFTHAPMHARTHAPTRTHTHTHTHKRLPALTHSCTPAPPTPPPCAAAPRRAGWRGFTATLSLRMGRGGGPPSWRSCSAAWRRSQVGHGSLRRLLSRESMLFVCSCVVRE